MTRFFKPTIGYVVPPVVPSMKKMAMAEYEHIQNMNIPSTSINRDAPARHGTEDPEIYGTARHGKSWHGKILARHGTENLGTEKYWHGMARKIRPISYG